MSEPLTIVQKRFGETLTFRFEDERLVRTHADRNGTANLAVFYNLIDVVNWTIVKVDRLKRHRLTIWALTAICAVGTMAPAPLATRMTLATGWAVGLGLMLAQRLRLISTTYTMFPITQPQTSVKFIKVLHDSQLDRIVAELTTRWKQRMRRLAGEIDFANEPIKEQRKFEWLRDSGVLSDEECRQAVQRIKAARGAAAPGVRHEVTARLN